MRGTTAITNVTLRVATLATRFSLVFVLAKYLDANSVGYYGIFTATVGYAILLFGLDMYIYTTREIINTDRERGGSILKNQIALACIIYAILSPIAIFVIKFSGFPPYLVCWFIPILILEHINQELYRLFIALSHQITASVLLFVRQGSWAVAVAGVLAASDGQHGLNMVMALWAGAGAIAAAAGIWKLRQLQLGAWDTPIDWTWIKRGVAVSGSFLVATLALRAVQTLDRYWLQNLAGIEVVGAYVLFFGVASALNVFLDAAIFSFRYPELIALGNRKRYDEMRDKVRQMALLTAGASLAFSLASSLLLPILLDWIGRDIYQSQIALYYLVLAGMIAYSLAMVPHYALYALGRDRPIIASHLAALLVFVAATLAVAPISRSYAIPVAVLISMLVVLFWKTSACIYAMRRQEKQIHFNPNINGSN